MATTTTKNGFRVQDITFKGARQQSEVAKEIGEVIETKEEIKAPVSLTPEQVIDFYKQSISVEEDTQTKLVFAQTIKWIEELQDTKGKLALLLMKEQRGSEEDEHPTDIEE